MEEKEMMLRISEEISVVEADVKAMNPDCLITELEILMKRMNIKPADLFRMHVFLNELERCGLNGESVTHEFARNATDDQYLLLNLVDVKAKYKRKEWNHSPVKR